jgi:crotonobetainyl-CoA:carnitine CoA-transferase CaiB-like acyl-CoA transferase
VSPETYEQLRQQVVREVTENIRAELRKETEAEQRRVQAKADVFYRTMQTHVEELVKHMSEAEGRWTELSTAVKNCGFKLKQALDGLGQGKT